MEDEMFDSADFDIVDRLRFNAKSADILGDTHWAHDMREAADLIVSMRKDQANYSESLRGMFGGSL